MDGVGVDQAIELPSPPGGKTGWPWTAGTEHLSPEALNGRPWPRISVVTPSYNQGQFIEETIRSVLLQGYPNLEYIVMDGGSTDGTVAILRRYEEFLTFLRIGRDNGQSAAISEGFQHASGEILAWINSDDRYLPGAFARAARFFSTHPRVVFGNGDVNYIDACGHFTSRIYAVSPNRFITANTSYHGWPQQGCFWRAKFYKQAGGMDESLRFCMDLDLFLRLTAIGPGARIPGPPLAEFRTHDRAKSTTIMDVADEEAQLLIDKYGNRGLKHRTRLLRQLWRLWTSPRSLRMYLNQTFGWEY